MLWNEAKAYYKGQGMDTEEVYGALIISYQVIVDEGARAKLMSQLMAKYPLDGVFVIFENIATSIATTVDKGYLEGLKEFCQFFEAVFDDVIVYRTDLSVLPFLDGASFATGWAKSARHFKPSGTGRNNDYKMRYFAPRLFTFVEEKSNIRAILDADGRDALACDCDYCKQAQPLEISYTPNQTVERAHFFHTILALHLAASRLSTAKRNEYYRTYLAKANTKGGAIKTASAGIIGSETIPGYESLIALIDN
jgi:hypothetical protein